MFTQKSEKVINLNKNLYLERSNKTQQIFFVVTLGDLHNTLDLFTKGSIWWNLFELPFEFETRMFLM